MPPIAYFTWFGDTRNSSLQDIHACYADNLCQCREMGNWYGRIGVNGNGSLLRSWCIHPGNSSWRCFYRLVTNWQISIQTVFMILVSLVISLTAKLHTREREALIEKNPSEELIKFIPMKIRLQNIRHQHSWFMPITTPVFLRWIAWFYQALKVPREFVVHLHIFPFGAHSPLQTIPDQLICGLLFHCMVEGDEIYQLVFCWKYENQKNIITGNYNCSVADIAFYFPVKRK